MSETARKTIQEISDDRLTDLIVLSSVPLVVDSRDTPDNIFPYVVGPLSSLTGLGSTIAYARFNPNSWQRRRDPVTNETLYNIDLPEWGTSPTLQHIMVGNRNHIDTSLQAVVPVYASVWYQSTRWSGMVYKIYEPTEEEIQKEKESKQAVKDKKKAGLEITEEDIFTYPKSYEPIGRQIQYTIYVDTPSGIIDFRYNTELFY